MPLYKELSSIASSQPRLPLVFLVDTSGSMRAASKKNPIEQVNCFLEKIPTELLDYRCDYIDLAVVEFGDTAKIVREFAPIATFTGVRLEADGMTAMGEGIRISYEMLNSLRRQYLEGGQTYYRPIILMLTDGEATDDIEQAKEIIAANCKKTSFWAAGIEGCNQEQLSELTKNSLFVDINEIGLSEFLCWFFSDLVGVYFKERRNIEGYNPLIPPGVHPINDVKQKRSKKDDIPGDCPQLPPTPPMQWDDWLD